MNFFKLFCNKQNCLIHFFIIHIFIIFPYNSFAYNISIDTPINTFFADCSVKIPITIKADNISNDTINLECLFYYNNIEFDKKAILINFNNNFTAKANYEFKTPNVEKSIGIKIICKIFVNRVKVNLLTNDIQVIPAVQNSSLKKIFDNFKIGVIDKNSLLIEQLKQNNFQFKEIINITELNFFDGHIIIIGKNSLDFNIFEGLLKKKLRVLILNQDNLTNITAQTFKFGILNNSLNCKNYYDYSDTKFFGNSIDFACRINLNSYGNGINFTTSADIKPLLKIDNGIDSSTNIIFEINQQRNSLLWCQLKLFPRFAENADEFNLFQNLLLYLTRESQILDNKKPQIFFINNSIKKIYRFLSEKFYNSDNESPNKIFFMTEINNNNSPTDYKKNFVFIENNISDSCNIIIFSNTTNLIENLYMQFKEKNEDYINHEADSTFFINKIFKYISPLEQKILLTDENKRIKNIVFLNILNSKRSKQQNIIFLPVLIDNAKIDNSLIFLKNELLNIIFNNILY